MLPKSCREYGLRHIRVLPNYLAVLLVVFNHWNLVNGSDSGVTFDIESTTSESDASGTTELITNPAFYIDIFSFEPPPPPSIRLSLVELGDIKESISQELNATVVIPVDKYPLSEGQDVPTRALRFDCSATFPVHWEYQGLGAPFNIMTRSFRHSQNISDPSTYTFSASIDLTKNDERNTGRYICKSTRVNISDDVYLQLYSPGPKLFLSVLNTVIKLRDNDTQFTIPCPVSNPSVEDSIKLYKDSGNGLGLIEFTLNKSVYNPMVGYTIEIDESIPINRYIGSFVCKHESGTTSAFHKVIPPKGSYVRVTPETNYVKIVLGQKQIFRCEAKENVTLTFSGDRQPRIIDFQINPSEEYPYVAVIEITPTNMSAEHTVINCVTSNELILHTWEYSTYEDVSISKFYFDGQKRYQDARYVCCSNSFYKPKMEYIFCKTDTECALKKRVLDENTDAKEQVLGEFIHRVSYINNTCVAFNPYLKYTLPTGLLRCSVHGISKSLSTDYIYYFNPYRIYQAYTDDKFDTEKVISSDSIMKLSKTPSRNTLIGQPQRFLCYYSELFFSNGVVWGVEMKNGSKYFLDAHYNDMKSNVSFSQLELTFNDTDVKAIQCFAPIKASPTQWRNVSGPVFIREPPQIQAYLKSKDGEILKHLNANSSKSNIILEIQTLDIDNNSIDGNTTVDVVLILECNATFPVDFTFSGEGSPKLDFQSYRHTGPIFGNTSAYSYSARVTFFEINQQIVGKYSCVSASREFGHRGKEENLKANLNIFVPGESLFVSKDNQTFRAWEYRDSLLIPCLVNDPRPNVTLLKLNNQTNQWEPLNTTQTLLYDPLIGFSLTKNHTKSLFGYYKCVGDKNMTSGMIQVYQPSDTVRVTPYVKELKIMSNETQNFKCESKENITLVFSDALEREVLYTTNFSSIYPYIAIYETKLGEVTNLTLLNCTSTNDSKALHSWELSPDDANYIDKFYYDNSTAEMKCCTKPYRSPTIEWMNCTSVSECYMRQSACLLQNKCQPSDFVLTEGLDKSQMNNGCLSMSVKDKPYGALKCVVKGVHKIVAQALLYYYNPEEDFQVNDGYFLGAKIFDKYDIKDDNVMKITQGSENNITLGDKVTFDCIASKFFSSAEIKWAIERTNGTLEYLDGEDLTNYTTVQSKIEMKFDSPNWLSIYCFAPNWKEYNGWRNVSLPLNFDIEL